MPIYDYSCDGCRVVHEVIHAMGDGLQLCPRCGVAMEKLLTSPAGVKITGTPDVVGFPGVRADGVKSKVYTQRKKA